jgi:dolichyl-phosphate-mannose--protein O-mannosyl transferase
VLAWGVLPVLTYYSSFIPFFWVTQKSGGSYGLFDILFQMQWAMWDGQSRVPGEHNYASRWWEWPLMLRPMWYAFDRESGPAAAVRGVALIGNPVVLWGGLAALVWTAWDWVEKRRAEAFLIVYAWAVCTFSWMVIPRKLAFFYYYYPAALWLAPAWIYLLQQGTPRGRQRLFMSAVTAVSLLLFIHFFPILAALPIEPQGYLKWMWLRRWI